MIKKILLILSFFCLFWFKTPTLLAQQPNSPSTTQTQESGGIIEFFSSIWESIVRFFSYLFGITYISEDYQASTKDTRHLTNDYTRQDKDIASRAIPESVKSYRKGVWFYEVLTKKNNKYRDEIIKSDQPDVCPDIKITEIIAVMCQQGQDILYQRENPNQPLSCLQAPIPSFTPKHPVSCYLNAYNNIQEVPQGVFMNQDSAAPMTSTQLNDTIRNIMPISFQGETAPPTNDTPQQAKKLSEDSDKQEQNMLLGILPHKTHYQIQCTNQAKLNRDNLRDAFSCNMSPDSWGNPNCGEFGDILDLDSVQCDPEFTVKNGPGLSQRGSHGLALSGYKYKEIIKLYGGDKVDVEKKFNDRDITNIQVLMVKNEDLNHDGVLDNDPNCTALVNRGLANKYERADLESGRGGYYFDNTPCVYETIPQPTDPQNPNYNPPPKYRVKHRGDLKGEHQDKCYSKVTMSNLHNYLLGVAEGFRHWHIESLKALVIAYRHTALEEGAKGFLYNFNADQVFQCNEVFLNLPQEGDKITNQGAAVEITDGEMIVDKETRKQKYFTPAHHTLFCGPGSYNPSFDGLNYELISYAYDVSSGSNRTISGICFEGVGYTLPYNKDIALSLDSSYLQAYQYNPNSQILGQIDNGQNNQSSNCRLDKRLFSSLDQLISAFNSQNPDNQLTLLSCYRSTQEQESLWQQYLSENKGDELKTISEINYPGTSPHQTGRAIDFGDKSGKLTSKSPAYKWLVSNASRFGFYHHQLEPEHWNYKP